MRRMIVTACVALVTVVSATGQERDTGGREAFTAVALSAGGPRSNPVATPVDIVIERWSTPAEQQQMMAALKQGQRALLDALQDARPTGYIRTPGSLSWDLRYAHQEPGEDGGRRIVLATDRPMSAAEVFNQPRTVDYPFTLIELRVNDRGDGEGKLSRATRVIASRNGRYIQLENWETQAVDLRQVKKK
jgi:hypothetical protein